MDVLFQGELFIYSWENKGKWIDSKINQSIKFSILTIKYYKIKKWALNITIKQKKLEKKNKNEEEEEEEEEGR